MIRTQEFLWRTLIRRKKREGIPYSYTAYNKERKEIGGNYFIVNITAPLEYTDVQGAEDKVIYQNSIEKAGGYIYGVGV